MKNTQASKAYFIVGGIRSFLSALTLLTLATPAFAGTWVKVFQTYEHQNSDNKQRSYQIDAQSISEHQGWFYAIKRICLNYGRDCSEPTRISAQCQQQRLTMNMAGYTMKFRLRNGNEWWDTSAFDVGNRIDPSLDKFLTPERRNSYMKNLAKEDNEKTKFYNFLCKG